MHSNMHGRKTKKREIIPKIPTFVSKIFADDCTIPAASLKDVPTIGTNPDANLISLEIILSEDSPIIF